MGMAVLTTELKFNSRISHNIFKDKGKALLYLFKRNISPHRKIKVFGEAIVWNITSLDGGAAFESKEVREGGF